MAMIKLTPEERLILFQSINADIETLESLLLSIISTPVNDRIHFDQVTKDRGTNTYRILLKERTDLIEKLRSGAIVIETVDNQVTTIPTSLSPST